jgi:hypothetical protein
MTTGGFTRGTTAMSQKKILMFDDEETSTRIVQLDRGMRPCRLNRWSWI